MAKRRFFTIWSIPLFGGLILGLVYLFYDKKGFWEEFHSRPHEYTVPDRTLEVMVAADSTFVDKYPKGNWQNEAQRLIEAASKIFEKQVGIKFAVCDFIEWPREYTLFLRTLDRYPKGRCDIKLGIVDVPLYRDKDGLIYVLGEATSDDSETYELPTGVYDSVRISTKFDKPLHLILAHEIAHLFGAEDRIKEYAGTLMARPIKYMGPKFDEKSWHIVVRNKYKDFQKDRIFRRIYEWFNGL